MKSNIKKINSFSGIMQSLNIFNNELKNLQYDPFLPRSAVAIIIKKKMNKGMGEEQGFIHEQILLLQRKRSQKDKFSGEICFPGGKQEENQPLITTVIRQTFQQTNIQLRQQDLLGCVDREIKLILSTKKKDKSETRKKDKSEDQNINMGRVYQGRRKQMVVYGFVFIVGEEEMNRQEIRLNEEEMQSYRWVDSRQLMSQQNICWLDYSERFKGVLQLQRSTSTNNYQLTQTLVQSISRILCPAMDIGMESKLYGVTLYIVLIVLVNLQWKLQEIIESPVGVDFNGNRKQLKSIVCQLAQIRQRCQSNIVFQINRPVDQTFRSFQNALLKGIYSLRPKL